MPIDRLIFVKTKYILNQSFVEVILDLVNDQIKSILERGNNKGIQKHALGRATGKKIEQFLVRHDLIFGLIAFKFQTEVVLILHGNLSYVLIENAENMRKRRERNVILFESFEHQLIGVGTFSVTVKIDCASFFFLQHKESNGSVLGQSANV